MAAVMAVGVSIALLTDLTDLKGGVIPNRLTYPLVSLGLLVHIGLSLSSGDWAPLLSSIEGAGIGLGLGFLAHLFGGFGGGDAKLLAAIGALVPKPLPPLIGTSALFPSLPTYPISTIVVLMNGLVLAMPFVAGFALYSFAKGRGVIAKEVPVSSLEEGDIPNRTVYGSGGSVEVGGSPAGEDVEVYGDPSDPQGFDRDTVGLLQDLAEKGEAPSTLEVRRTFPFAPVIAAGTYSMILFGNLYLRLLVAFL